MKIETKYSIQDIVYLITDTTQQEYMIIGITIRLGAISYELAIGTTSSWHYEYEISSSKDELKRLISN